MKRIIIVIWLIFFVYHLASSQPTYETFTTNIGNAAIATINKPTGTIADDLLIANISYEKGSGEIITPPAGWSLIIRNDNSTDAGLAIYYLIAGAAEPASYNFTLVNGSKWSIGCSRISGINTAGPIDLSGGSTGNGTAVSAPSVTTTENNTLVLGYYTNKKSSTYTADITTTERYDVPNTPDGIPSNMLATFVQASAGATGNKVATSSDSESWSAVQVAVRFDITLPVELLYFTARSEGNAVLINWATATEINNDYFSIEKSKDGITFQELSKVNGAGNSDEKIEYQAVDESPFNGITYYRIKQTDFDGQYEYSNLIVADYTREFEVQLFPNPSSRRITLTTARPLDNVTVFIKNSLNKAIKEISNISGHSIIIDREDLPSGLYFLQLMEDDRVLSINKIMITD